MQAHNLEQEMIRPPVMIRVVKGAPGNYIPIVGAPRMSPGQYFMASDSIARQLFTHAQGDGQRMFEITQVNDFMQVLAGEDPNRSPKSYSFTELPAWMNDELPRVSRDAEVDGGGCQSLTVEQLLTRAKHQGAVLDGTYEDMVRMHAGQTAASADDVAAEVEARVAAKFDEFQAKMMAQLAKMDRDSAPNDEAVEGDSQKILEALDTNDEKALIELGVGDPDKAPSKVRAEIAKQANKKKASAKKSSKTPAKKTTKKSSKRPKGAPRIGGQLG